MASWHDTKVDLLSGPSNGDILVPGETFCTKVSLLPQNHYPSAITQVFLFAGPRDGDKQVHKLMNDTPGLNPYARNFDFEYTVPDDIVSAHNKRAFLEFGWGWDMQYNWADALRNFRNGVCKGQVLLTLQVTLPGKDEPRKDFTLPELSSKEDYTCTVRSSSCLVYASRGFTQAVSVETIIEPQLHPKLQANEIRLTPVVCILPQAFIVNKPAIVELMKTIEPSQQNPNHKLIPLYSFSDPFEWKKLDSHGCEMLEDRIVFKTTHFGYFTVIAHFSLPTSSVTVKPKVSQPTQLMIQELPGFKVEIPPTSVYSETKITATVHYDDLNLCGNLSNSSPASACVMLEPHNAQFEDRIMITMPIPNYNQIKRKYPNIKLEMWHTDNRKKGAPVKLKLVEESSITIHQDDDSIYLATAYVTHFSGFMYLWNAIVDYCLNFFVQNIRGRCQVFMSRETKRGSCITFGITVLLYPFKDPYSSLPNYPYILYDSVLPITLNVAGEMECQIELDELLLRGYQNSRNHQCYTERCRFSKDFNMRTDFRIRLDTTLAVESQLPEGDLATLFIKYSSDGVNAYKFNLIKPPVRNVDHDTETSSGPVTVESPGPVHNETQVYTVHPIELAACQLIKTTKQLKENVIVEAARRMAEHMKTIAFLACSPDSDEKSSSDNLFDTIQSIIKESLEINKTAREVAAACTEQGLKKNVLEVVGKIPAIAGQLKIISKGTKIEDYSKETIIEAIDMLTHNAKNLIHVVEEVLYATERAIIKLPASEMERLNLIQNREQASKPAIGLAPTDVTESSPLVQQNPNPWDQHSPTFSATPHLDATPTLAMLSVLKIRDGKKIQIIKRMATHWRKIGFLMDFDETGTQLDIIGKNHPFDAEACCQAVFKHWVKGNGIRPCSWRKLIELIDICDQKILAKAIGTALSPSTS